LLGSGSVWDLHKLGFIHFDFFDNTKNWVRAHLGSIETRVQYGFCLRITFDSLN